MGGKWGRAERAGGRPGLGHTRLSRGTGSLRGPQAAGRPAGSTSGAGGRDEVGAQSRVRRALPPHSSSLSSSSASSSLQQDKRGRKAGRSVGARAGGLKRCDLSTAVRAAGRWAAPGAASRATAGCMRRCCDPLATCTPAGAQPTTLLVAQRGGALVVFYSTINESKPGCAPLHEGLHVLEEDVAPLGAAALGVPAAPGGEGRGRAGRHRCRGRLPGPPQAPLLLPTLTIQLQRMPPQLCSPGCEAGGPGDARCCAPPARAPPLPPPCRAHQKRMVSSPSTSVSYRILTMSGKSLSRRESS